MAAGARQQGQQEPDTLTIGIKNNGLGIQMDYVGTCAMLRASAKGGEKAHAPNARQAWTHASRHSLKRRICCEP
eukprot:250757-Chlamydomonas_euryale.AAC.12